MKNTLQKVVPIVLVSFMLAGCSTGKDISEVDNNSSDTTTETSIDNKYSDYKIGISVYAQGDNYIDLYREKLSSVLIEQGFSEDNIIIDSAENDYDTQLQQVKDYIEQDVDVIVVNLVNTSEAGKITDLVVEAGTPLIYVNREPSSEEELRWKNGGWDVTYIGNEGRQAGTIQGEIIAELGLDTVDLNGNGQIDYIMMEGDPQNVEAIYRTEYSIKALTDAGFRVNCLDDQVANWEKDVARQLVAEDLRQYGNDIEVVFCNNDAMALGALDAIEAEGRVVGDDIFLVGVDALSEAVDNIVKGKMTGTVLNDYVDQAESTVDVAKRYLNGESVEYYIGGDYIKVTLENASNLQEMMRNN